MRAVNVRDHGSDTGADGDKPVDLTAYVDVLLRYRWTFLSVAGAIFCMGLIFALLASPTYRADIMVQVEESNPNANAGRLAAALSPALDIKASATSEIELLRSRMVVGKAVDNLRLDIEATPRYFPVLGKAIAGVNKELSRPGLLGWGGFAWGQESITVPRLEMPAQMEGSKLMLTAMDKGQYRVRFAGDNANAVGVVGTPLSVQTSRGKVDLLVSQLDGRPGAQFVLRRHPRAETIAQLQDDLRISERGKQSGMIAVSLEGGSAEKTAAVLNDIGREYVEQNLRRKAEEAEKSLSFLEQQLPQLRQQVETAENRYNAMRNQRGTIDLSEESKLILSQSVQIQTKLQELRAKRQELAARYTNNHPTLEIIDGQIASLSSQLNGVTGRIQKLPDVEQNVLRLMRDVKVSTEMLQALLNDVQQLKLMKASKVGSARMVDSAEVPVRPERPNRAMIAGLAALIGVLAGLLVTFVRSMLSGGIAEADEIEQRTGLTVYSTIPYSAQQEVLQPAGKDNAGLLACQHPEDPAMESLRSFRTALQFALAGNRNRVVLLSGPAPGVGKSFISANFAALVGSGRRVVLIDADLRRGDLHRRFDVQRSPGLTEILMGTPLDQVLRYQVAPGLDFIPTGTEPAHAADVLQNPGLDALLDELRMRYDLVLIDAPPVLAAADATILAGKAGVVFLVARAEVTTANELNAARRAIEHAGAEVKGVIFNGLKVEGRWYRSHYHFGKYRYLNEYGSNAKRA